MLDSRNNVQEIIKSAVIEKSCLKPVSIFIGLFQIWCISVLSITLLSCVSPRRVCLTPVSANFLCISSLPSGKYGQIWRSNGSLPQEAADTEAKTGSVIPLMTTRCWLQVTLYILGQLLLLWSLKVTDSFSKWWGLLIFILWQTRKPSNSKDSKRFYCQTIIEMLFLSLLCFRHESNTKIGIKSRIKIQNKNKHF